MLRTFVSELTSLVNSDSAWKISKGRRSVTRRNKNLVVKGTDNCAGVILSNPEHSNMPVSESEKRGISVLGCSFSDKIEHVPIKKRRFLLRTSPPPPPPPLSSPEEDISKKQDASNELAAKESSFSEINPTQVTDNNISDEAKKSEKASDVLGCDEDFSGMSILAAAACNSSSGNECGYAEEQHSRVEEECSIQGQLNEVSVKSKEPSLSEALVKNELNDSREISVEPVGELLSLSTSVSSLENVDSVGRCVEGSMSRDVICSKDEEKVGNRSLSSRDDRLHWDLNVVMDDWEQSFEDSDPHNELSHNKSDEGEKYSCDDDKRERVEKGLGLGNTLATTLDKQNTVPLLEPRVLPIETKEYKEQSGTGAYHNVSDPISSDVKSHLPNYNSDPNQTKCMVEDAANYVHHHLESVTNVDKLVTSVLDDRCQPSEAKTISKGEDHLTKNPKLVGDGNSLCNLALDVKSSLSCGPCELEKKSDSPSGNASAGIQTHFCNSLSSDNKIEVTPHLAGMDNVESSRILHDEEIRVSIEKLDLKTNDPVGHNSAVVSNEISLPCVKVIDNESLKYVALATSDNMHDIIVTQNANLVKMYETASNVNHEIQQVTSKGICDSLVSDSCKASDLDNNLCFSEKIDTIEKHDSGDDGAHLECHVSGLHEDYDSQYEDGELRETNECEWDEYCGGRNAKPMVCEEDMETSAISPVHYHVSESGQVDVGRNVVMEVMCTIPPSSVGNFENEGSIKAAGFDEGDNGTDVVDKNKIKTNSLTEEKANATRSEESPIINRSSLERVKEVRDNNDKNVATLSCGDVLVSSGCTEMKVEAKSYRRGLRSQIEAPVTHDGSCRDDRLDKVDNRYEETSCVRNSERVRYPVHGRGRGRDVGSWNSSFDGRRGFKRHYSPIFHGRLKRDDDDDGIVEREDIGCVDSQNDPSYGGIHSRCKPHRKFSPDRPSTFGRERPFRYGPSGRGRYNNGPSKDEIFQSSLKYRRPLSHRERSLSPFGARGQPNTSYHSRGKSPSRSRSRSPLMWNPQRGRPGGSNTFIRHRSRSPNFRSEVRVQRPRSPIHQQPGFTGDRAPGFRSFPRNNYNSPPHSRWTSGRKDESGHFRDFGCKPQRSFPLERSPGRNIKRTDRPGVIDSLRNMKSDGYYRMSEEGGGGREFRYEDNYEDRRKHYGTTLCPNRRSFDDGITINDIRDRDTSGFQGRGLRGIGCRIGDLPRLRGDHHSLIHEREGKFNSDSKQFVGDVMDSSSDMQQQSEEQFQSQPGRFPVVDGQSRGRRYDNYEDRRKQYGGVFREGTEKRPNHLFDRNFQDSSFYPRRSVRNFEGQIGNLSTRLGEHHDSVVSRQEEKLEDNNAQSFGGGNSDDHDIPKGRVST